MKPTHRILASCILLIIGQTAGRAQTVPTPPATAPAAPAAGDTVVLNPFLVSSGDDTGYAATNTLDGSRLNTALRDTPAAISVVTKDFLDDIGATDITSLLRFFFFQAEDGIRDLEREIGSCLRKIARKYVLAEEKEGFRVVIDAEKVKELLGTIRFRKQDIARKSEIGLVKIGRAHV